MKPRMKVIETEYAGHRFRSRIEARWACFMDVLGVRWEYEKEGFEFGDGTRYLPDFWLPDLHCWVEVKGARPLDSEIEKAERLRDETEWPVVMLAGAVSSGPHRCFASDIGHSSGGSSEWEVRWYICDGCGKPKISWGDGCHTIVGPEWGTHPVEWCLTRAFKPTGESECGPKWSEHNVALDAPIRRAVKAAKSARFEHGESGPTL